MYYYRARYYRPAFSRFVAEDLIGLAGGANLYAYVGGNPSSYIDRYGKFIFNLGAARVGAAIGVSLEGYQLFGWDIGRSWLWPADTIGSEIRNFRVDLRLNEREKENAGSSGRNLRRWDRNIPQDHAQSGKSRSLFSRAAHPSATT